MRGRVRKDAPLNEYTTFRIGGPARLLVEPRDVNDLKVLIRLIKRYTIPCFLLGAGSNILADDRGVNGVVVRLQAPHFRKIRIKGRRLEAGGGALLAQVIRAAGRRGLAGAEFLVGIPGTLGGALAMNAGIPEKTIADFFEDATVLDGNASLKTIGRDGVRFGYRKSGLAKYIIISARLKFSPGDPSGIKNRMREQMVHRMKQQDYSLPSAGCVFRNPASLQGVAAGKLIDRCGLKGARVNDACVSEKHANFIVNKGRARSSDVEQLMRLVQKKVSVRFHIQLQPEIRIWH